MRRIWVLGAVALLAGSACILRGGGGVGTPGGGSTSGGSIGQPFSDVRRGLRDDHVVVGFTGPDPAGGAVCHVTYGAEVRVDTRNVVVITLKAMLPRADPSCAQIHRKVVVDLGEPLAGREIQDEWTGRRYRPTGGTYELEPESTPCGRADCSTPSPTPAPCETEAYQAAVDNIDGGIRFAGERCDGSFLVMSLDFGSSGCAPARQPEPCPCLHVQPAYFV